MDTDGRLPQISVRAKDSEIPGFFIRLLLSCPRWTPPLPFRSGSAVSPDIRWPSDAGFTAQRTRIHKLTARLQMRDSGRWRRQSATNSCPKWS